MKFHSFIFLLFMAVNVACVPDKDVSEKEFLDRPNGSGADDVEGEDILPDGPFDLDDELIEMEPLDESDILDLVEVEPEFPGGEGEMMNFIQRHVEYPQQAVEMGEQGIVYVSFVVRRNGDISDVEVMRGVSPSLDAEAVRVVRSMPNWTPGRQNGSTVNVRFTLPIHFRLG